MKIVRIVLSAVSILLLAGGYIASQYAAYVGQAPAYASLVDQAPIRTLALFLFTAMVASLFFPERQSEDKV